MHKLNPGSKLLHVYNQLRHPNTMIVFTFPVILENVLGNIMGTIVSSFVGKLNNTSLAAMGTGGYAAGIITALFCLITVSSSVMTARAFGSGNIDETNKAVNQSMFLTIVCGLVLSTAFAVFANPIMRLLIPTAEPQLFDETVEYFRLFCISYPFFSIFLTGSGLLRAVGMSGKAMICSVFVNASYLVLVIIALTCFDLGLEGVGYALILARILSTLLVGFFLFRCPHFRITFKAMFSPDFPMLKRLIKLGTPNAMEQVFIQLGYLIANSLIIGLGTKEAAVFSVANSIHPFSSVVQAICSTSIITLVGQALGETDIPKAKQSVRKLWIIGMIASILLSVGTGLLGVNITSLFSNDPVVIKESANVLWILLSYNIFALSINVIDPALKTGGDTRFVMLSSSLSVWLIRLPLTYLFCYIFSFGVWGIYLANILNLAIRSVLGLIRYYKGRWTTIKV